MALAPTTTAPRTDFWSGNLGYAHSFVTVCAALTIGLILHIQIGYDQTWSMTALMLFAGVPLVAMLMLGRVLRQNRIMHWLTGIPFAVTSTLGVGVLAIVGGVVTVADIQQRTGAPSMWASWPFMMAMFLMLLNLAGSVGKRSWPLTYTNVVFLLSHAGLLVSMVGGVVGALTLERQLMMLTPGAEVTESESREGIKMPMPFSVTLREFDMETFPPQILLATRDPKTEEGMRTRGGDGFIKPGATWTLDGVHVEVLKWMPKAVYTGVAWREVPWKTAAPAALVRAKSGNLVKEGWISCGSIESPQAMLTLDDNRVVAMPKPMPKKFRSTVDITEAGKTRRETIEVNKPAVVAGYTLYQVSYNEKLGAASDYSVIEAVHDRGLPIVFIGMAMVLIAACLHLWNGVGGNSK